MSPPPSGEPISATAMRPTGQIRQTNGDINGKNNDGQPSQAIEPLQQTAMAAFLSPSAPPVAVAQNTMQPARSGQPPATTTMPLSRDSVHHLYLLRSLLPIAQIYSATNAASRRHCPFQKTMGLRYPSTDFGFEINEV
ncbi:hypothetical protein FXO37_24689 [Capsicum annuum]|nr:hypothetical protein FXO37_24689 [Capsicum annuum]